MIDFFFFFVRGNTRLWFLLRVKMRMSCRLLGDVDQSDEESLILQALQDRWFSWPETSCSSADNTDLSDTAGRKISDGLNSKTPLMMRFVLGKKKAESCASGSRKHSANGSRLCGKWSTFILMCEGCFLAETQSSCRLTEFSRCENKTLWMTAVGEGRELSAFTFLLLLCGTLAMMMTMVKIWFGSWEFAGFLLCVMKCRKVCVFWRVLFILRSGLFSDWLVCLFLLSFSDFGTNAKCDKFLQDSLFFCQAIFLQK